MPSSIQDEMYHSKKVGEDKKLSLSARVDLRDLASTLQVLEAIFGINYTGASKSQVISESVEALATMGYAQGYIEEVPATTEEAEEFLAKEYGITFTSNEEHAQKLEEFKAEDFLRRQEETKKQLEDEGEKMEGEKKEKKESPLDESIEDIFHQINELPDPFPALIQLGQKERFSNQEIAKHIAPLLARDEDELEMSQFFRLKTFFEENAPEDATDHF